MNYIQLKKRAGFLGAAAPKRGLGCPQFLSSLGLKKRAGFLGAAAPKRGLGCPQFLSFPFGVG